VVTQKASDPSIHVFRAAWQNIKHLFKSPRVFLKDPIFLLVCCVYSGTYIAANSTLTICEYAKVNPTAYKLAATTAVNFTLGIYKDDYIAKHFSKDPPKKFPIPSWALFVTRDMLTIAAGFTIPPVVSKMLQDSETISSKTVADTVAQVAVPITAQIFLTPIHLLALDFYMAKGANVSPMERVKRMIGNAPATTAIRMWRVFFAYSIAGVFNVGLRTRLREMFIYEDDPAQLD
jgi:hypothetical protein